MSVSQLINRLGITRPTSAQLVSAVDEDIGYSPDGEQPKFTATVVNPTGRRAVLAKFAIPDSGQSARR